LYSDALIETPSISGEFISETALVSLLEKYQGAPAAAIKEIILDYFHRHAVESLRDDLTLIVCKRN
jgi:serine phosphatase RsbU (regulator of sigma subunit)